MEYKNILSAIEDSINRFNKNIPAAQRTMFDAIEEELRRLDMNGKNIKATVRNLKVIASIKNKLQRLILTDEYKESVKEFAKSFNTITTLQNEYWKGLESSFKPTPLLREIRKQAITDTVKGLTGVDGITEQITSILKTNITTGGSMKALTAQLRESLLNTETDGLLVKYVKTITTDSINQYSNQVNQVIGSDLGFEWLAYRNSNIATTRPFCDAMTDRRYFHISSIPNLLKRINEDGSPLQYKNKEGKMVQVPVYEKTGLPGGMIPGTDPSNFQIRRGGYQCGHSIQWVPERNVKSQAPEIYNMVINAAPYKAWKKANGK